MGAGRRSTAGEGLAQLPADSRSCSDKDLLIVFLFLVALFFQDVFFSCFVQWPSNLPQAIVSYCSSTTPILLLAVSTCLFYLAADSL